MNYSPESGIGSIPSPIADMRAAETESRIWRQLAKSPTRVLSVIAHLIATFSPLRAGFLVHILAGEYHGESYEL